MVLLSEELVLIIPLFLEPMEYGAVHGLSDTSPKRWENILLLQFSGERSKRA